MDSTAPATAAQPLVPAELLPFRQFVTWRLIEQPGNAKPRKVPFNPATGYAADPTNAATWADFATACAAFAGGGYAGIGFVFTNADPFVFVDLDDCRDPNTGAYSDHAIAIVQALQGPWEVSQSGKGLHGIGRLSDPTRLADKRRKWTDAAGNKHECYASARFMAIGGGGWTTEPVADWTDQLAVWVPGAERLTDFAAVAWLDRPREGYDGPADDDDLIRRAMARRTPLASVGVRASFADLWTADAVSLGEHWPDDARAFDHSSADLALCNALAFWTGCNPARMLRLFQRSALWRDDERKARLAVAKAINDPDRPFYSRAQRLRDDERIGDDLTADAFPEVLTIEQATADLVFIGNGSLVVSRRSKRMRSKADAVNEWAASKFTVETGRFDAVAGRPVTKDVPVVKLWLESRDRRSADVLAWSPGEAEFCRSPERQQAGDRAFNMWTPPTLMQRPDDWKQRVTPFVQHVAYLVPIEGERIRFTQWLAHMFQRPGELPHTCYLMFTPKTGTGRGTLASILTRAMRGYVAANVSADTLFGNFNGRLSMKLLATVDEIREGNGAQRHAKGELLKSKITEDYREINPKYGAQSVEKNCCRWLMFSNHADALPFDNTDRRIIVIENPTECATADWYGALHDAMDDPTFIASVQHYLSTFDLTGFNPHAHAPMNAAKAKALASLTTDAENAVAQFAREWPGDFAFLSDLRSYVADERKGDEWCRHEAERAGMQNGRDRFKVAGRWERLLVVRGSLTAADVADPAWRPQLREAVERARAAMTFA